jgi:hypothetical protein
MKLWKWIKRFFAYDGCQECRDRGYHVCNDYDIWADELLVH